MKVDRINSFHRLRSWSLAAALLSCTSAIGIAQAHRSAGLTGVAHIALQVTDLDAEVKFLNKLGFERAFATEENGRTAFVFVKVNDSEFLEIHPRTPVNGKGPLPLGFSHICFTTDDANGEHAKWIAAGLTPTPVSKGVDGTLEFGVKDPSGAMTEALQILPDSQPGKDRGQHLGSNRVSDWLMGIDLPVSDVEQWKKFYEALGFKSTSDQNGILETSPSRSDVQVRIHRATPDDRTQVFFAIRNVRNASVRLRSAGFEVAESNERVVIKDPDGNPLVFESMGKHK